MDKSKYIEDIEAIKSIMQRSSRTLSLSGWSGIIIGCIALSAAFLVYRVIYQDQSYLSYRIATISSDTIGQIVLIACITLSMSILAGVYFNQREAKKHGQSIFDPTAIKLYKSLLIPLLTGGIVCLLFLIKGLVGLVAPLTLVFYGLALVNGNKFAYNDIQTLGIIQIGIGLLAIYFIGYGLIFWALGFGVMHIIYGLLMQLKSAR